MRKCCITVDGIVRKGFWITEEEGVNLLVHRKRGKGQIAFEVYPSCGEIQLYNDKWVDSSNRRDVRLNEDSIYVARAVGEMVDVPLTAVELKYMMIALHISSNEEAKEYFRGNYHPYYSIGKKMDAELASHLTPSRKKGATH